ncbi:glycerol kinase GlpK [candidate division KSB1 bacterium]|nr:glycerol kinase GlpK [candidate division KSB1 bacterium]
MKPYILAIDQGTTGTTVLVFNREGKIVSKAYSEFKQIYPKPGWVEHDPDEIWQTTMRVIHTAIEAKRLEFSQIEAIGITNQRETTVVWDRTTGEPVHNAIVWQCRRTASICDDLKASGYEQFFKERTGLVIDAYFSGTKVKWILDNIPGARQKAQSGDLLFGTIDSWLIWKLSGGKVHATDYTNASRTLLFNIQHKKWDAEILKLLDIPDSMLPKVENSSGILGATDSALPFGREIPIAGVAGDQQAALFGQACWKPGMIKNTYGTGCFIMYYTGSQPMFSRSGLLTTLCCDAAGKPAYALEGSVFIAGAAVQWLRDELKLIDHAAESELAALEVADTGGVYVIPAFAGLGAPHWDMEARGAIVGLTRGSNRNHIIRATLESIAYQTKDVIDAMVKDSGIQLKELRVDGGATSNDFLMQFQADILGAKVNRPRIIETTALGAAVLAGLAIGYWKSADELTNIRITEKEFEPKMEATKREQLFSGWYKAVSMVSSKYTLHGHKLNFHVIASETECSEAIP